MFAGNGANGADDAWYVSNLQFERAALKGIPITGGTADIFKCFDQVLRDLLRILLIKGGMPARVVNPYMAYMNTLQLHNTVANTLGQPYNIQAGIPQGCPLSMMYIAFLLRPWICKMDEMGAVPRILADDILLFAQGPKHEEVFKQAFEATHVFVADIGANLAPAKSTTFSTVESTRQKLKATVWKYIGQKIKVVVHTRDLGSHLCTGKTLVAPTITDRLIEATKMVERIRRTPYSYRQKAQMIRVAAIPKGLYGAEAAAVPEQALQAFRTAIANTIAPPSRLRSLAM